VITRGALQQNDDLLFALRMLSLGLGAWQIIDSQVFTEPKLVNTSIYHSVLHFSGKIKIVLLSLLARLAVFLEW